MGEHSKRFRQLGLPFFFFLSIVNLALFGGEPATFPPAPNQRPEALAAEQDARRSLFEGRAEAALRLLLAAGPESGAKPAYLRLLALTYLSLDRPMRALESLATAGPEEKEMASLLLRRQAPEAAQASFRSGRGDWPGVTKDLLKEKDARGVLSTPDGNLWILGKDRLWQLSPYGRTLLTVSLPGAQDLCPDAEGGPVALGSRQVFWRGKVSILPADLAKPISAAESPGGHLLVLDAKTSTLFRLNASGQVEGRSVFSLDDPVRVRTDGSGRVYLLDASTRCVYIYSAALNPVRVLDPEARGFKLKKASGLFVDFAGDMLLLDGREDVAALFSAQGRFLGASRREDMRMDAVGWDGSASLIFLDPRGVGVGRASL